MKNYLPFHLTINRDGVVRLWDREELARAVTNDKYVCIIPTPEQIGILDAAAEEAAHLNDRWVRSRC